MLQRILVALDGSPESEQILSEVERVATPHTAINLLHVLQREPQEIPNVGLMVEDVAKAYLQRVAERIPERQVRTLIRRGEPEEEIPKAARSVGADLIALTTHGRRGLSHLLMGSVAENVVRNSSVPVLLTRPGLARPRKPLERILVPIDGSNESKQVCETVRRLVARATVEVILLQVLEPMVVGDVIAGIDPIGISDTLPHPVSDLDTLARELEREGFKVRVIVVSGSAPRQILEQAKGLDADMIAMTTAGRKGLARILMGSVSVDVLRHADRAVLLHRIGPDAEAGMAAQELRAQSSTN
jgi:nucleotide-binding universal stress UspA family protein